MDITQNTPGSASKNGYARFKEDITRLRSIVPGISAAGEIERLMEHKTAYGRLRDTAEALGSNAALRYFGFNMAYGELLERIDSAADGFAELGIRYGDVVAMSLLASPSAIIAFYALDKIGAVMHMVNCTAGIDEIRRELFKIPSKAFVLNGLFYSDDLLQAFRECGGEHMISVSLTEFLPIKPGRYNIRYMAIEKAKGLSRAKMKKNGILSFMDLMRHSGSSSLHVEPAEYSEDKDVAVAYTSGTTGESKAVVATWKSIDSLVQVMAMTEQGRFAEGDIMLSAVPMWIFYSLLNMIHEPLVLGVSLAFDPVFDASRIADLNRIYRFNHHLTGVVYLEKMVKANRKTDCSGWKIILTGGSALPDSLKLQADEYIRKNGGSAKVEQGFGATELLGSFAYGYIPDSTLGSVGVPCLGNMVRIVDPGTMEEVGSGETGLCLVYSPSVMKGYYHDEEATDSVLIKDSNGAVWYSTGDLVHQNEKGELFLVGRIKRMELTIDEFGNPAKLVPDEISMAIRRMDIIESCEVITIPDDKAYNIPIAFAVLKDKDKSKEDASRMIIEFCKEQLASYKVPADVVILNEIPVTGQMNKPDYSLMAEMCTSRNSK